MSQYTHLCSLTEWKLFSVAASHPSLRREGGWEAGWFWQPARGTCQSKFSLIGHWMVRWWSCLSNQWHSLRNDFVCSEPGFFLTAGGGWEVALSFIHGEFSLALNFFLNCTPDLPDRMPQGERTRADEWLTEQRDTFRFCCLFSLSTITFVYLFIHLFAVHFWKYLQHAPCVHWLT